MLAKPCHYVVDFAAKVIEQAAKPDTGKLLVESAIDIGVKPIADKVPILSPLINEAAEVLKNTKTAADAKKKVNQ